MSFTTTQPDELKLVVYAILLAALSLIEPTRSGPEDAVFANRGETHFATNLSVGN